jgi:hypothetical protein
MREEGFDYGEAGVRQFAETYDVLEKLTTIEPSENACSKARVSTTIKRRPGASPLLFGKYLMKMAAFVSLEDISEALPPYTEEVIAVEMDPALREAYSKLETDISDALRQHHGNSSVISIGMNALLLYPDREIWARFTDTPLMRRGSGSDSSFPNQQISTRTSSTRKCGG